MKTIIVLAALLVFAGCARFSTKQTDISSNDDKGKPTRTITTKASAFTLFTAKSDLATWKASQTDKSQGATVGGLNQQGGITGEMIAAAVTAAVKAAVKP